MRIILLLIIFLPVMGYSEGPPVEKNGKVFVDHIVINLTDIQLERLEIKRLVEFTPSQLQHLKTLNLQIPKIIPVVTPTYNNCTCDFTLYGIWNNERQIAIPLYLFESEAWMKYPLAYEKQIENWGYDFFVIDTKANIYFQGKEITKDELFKIVKQSKSDVAFIDLPLIQSPQVSSKVNTLLKSLQRNEKNNNVRIQY